MNVAAKIRTAERYFRRKYAADLPGLNALIEEVAESAFESVTITGQSAEGINSQGALTFPPAALLDAAMNIRAELDAENEPVGPAGVTHADFSSFPVQT